MAAASLGAGRIAALQQLTPHPQHHRRPAGFTLCTREIPAGRSVCTSGSSPLRRECQPRMPPGYRAAPINPETTRSCSRGAAGMSSLGEAALGSLGPPGLALVSSLSRHRSSCPRPRWPRGPFPALAMDSGYSHRGGPKSTVSRALSCSFCRWLRSVILSTVPIMVALFTASLHNRGKTRAVGTSTSTRNAPGIREIREQGLGAPCYQHKALTVVVSEPRCL